MRTMIPLLFGLLTGWTCNMVYEARHKDRLSMQAEDETAKRLVAEYERDRAQSRELTAKVELDTMRRQINMPVKPTGGDRIPAPSTPYPTK